MFSREVPRSRRGSEVLCAVVEIAVLLVRHMVAIRE
jgi:hypothetical protein